MSGRAYTIFDTAIGRCGIAWGARGIVGVQLPEAREIETRKRLFLLYPEAREACPPSDVEAAIEGMVALLHGDVSDCPTSRSIWAAFTPSTSVSTRSRDGFR